MAKPPRAAFTYALIHYNLCEFFDSIHAKCHGQAETGGILIGSYRGPHLEIIDRTEPGPHDLATLTSFKRQDQRHQYAAASAWRQSNETLTYVGEWHTHPLGAPHPSSLDRESWHSMVERLRTPCAFVVVSPPGWGVFRISGPRQPGDVSKLSPVELGERGIVFR